MTTPFITSSQADKLLSWNGICDALYQGHRMPPAQTEDVYLQHQTGGYFNRCAWIPGLGMATKAVSVFPDNPKQRPPRPTVQGAVLLFDDKGGALDAVIDGELVTKWKTTGDSILGARLLAPENPACLLIVGAGVVACHLFDAYTRIFPTLKKVYVWNRTRKHAENFIARVSTTDQSQDRLQIVLCEDLGAAAAQADIISCATMTVEPVLKGVWIKPDTHVDLIGAFRPDMREADDDLMRAAQIYVDSRQSTIDDIGEIRIPLATGVIGLHDIKGDLYDLCTRSAAPEKAGLISVFKNGGGGHLDLICARYIYTQFIHAQNLSDS